MPDASWWSEARSESIPSTLPEAQAEVRLLRSALLRIHDEQAGVTSWEEMRVARLKVLEIAREALPWRLK